MSGGRSRAIDIAFVGAGLASGLCAYRLSQTRPELSVALFESGAAVGGNHTWSFHDGDLTAAEHEWLKPFVTSRWEGNEVRFPDRRRRMATGYASVSSDRFRKVLEGQLGDAITTGAEVERIEPRRLRLCGGQEIAAGCVVDGRGHRPSDHLRLGFQKFLGQEIDLEEPHRLLNPIIMDATVTQADGYRFVYVLPLSPTRLLVEDTYYADGPDLQEDRLRKAIADYLDAHGWRASKILREERGVLPIAIDGDIEAFWNEKDGVPAIGLAAGLFHPTTGYSLPDAVRLADRLAAMPDLSAEAVFAETRRHAVATWKARGFFRMLNRLLFFAGVSSKRYRILQHFYRLPDPVIARFYAARLTLPDKARILTGKPPVPFGNAIRVLARHRLTGELA
ncbi:lycopene beta-cyclase CrtY [Aurantimonas sp. VKM B-3413]|uniref:lycopene beta-cyclase CrtY n=1 Tax=Aurantimonas sp. VKM B-3413 TaxID=2779401 RepID=UPI001E3DCCF6|nr:lycopene beta-cyclase CrtY [Aurantimonas sp. VKM B-3413]MCB8838729.1 lycopene beta-cyclase CrtY [Aurantimonas sp. VKM B-3413]